jgi:hypothetical protein
MTVAFLAMLALGIGIGLVLQGVPAAHGDAVQGDKPAAGPHYSVVETEGHNLIVTDNKTNTLYFYTIDKGAEIGSDLKLRGSLDLTQIGKDTLKPKLGIPNK